MASSETELQKLEDKIKRNLEFNPLKSIEENLVSLNQKYPIFNDYLKQYIELNKDIDMDQLILDSIKYYILSKNNLETIDILIKSGIDPNGQDKWKRSYLSSIYAIVMSNYFENKDKFERAEYLERYKDLIDFFIENGARINFTRNDSDMYNCFIGLFQMKDEKDLFIKLYDEHLDFLIEKLNKEEILNISISMGSCPLIPIEFKNMIKSKLFDLILLFL